ncbi:MAG: M67 family metallopeptidase, partial [Synergistaceae bacterium]|nr:M67 family metallopeptidase [Synergistaceae bacterium]
MIFLPEALRLSIGGEGEREYPDECCGVLLGRLEESGAKIVTEILPVRNSREDGERYHRFVIEPDDFMRAELFARKRGLDVLGFYHSHPDHPSSPSDYDREHALPFYSYVIIAVDSGKASEMTSWELTPDRGRFV